MKASFTAHIADYFKAHPDQWIDGRTLAQIGGAYAWRSRVSDARKQYGLEIENRQRRVTVNHETFVISEYRMTGAAFRLTA